MPRDDTTAPRLSPQTAGAASAPRSVAEERRATTPSGSPEETDLVFYDGHCGLCHQTVRFLLRHDPEGTRFRFAPLEGETFRREVPDAGARRLPDSVVVKVAASGELLVRSTATAHLLRRLAGIWYVLGSVLRCVPRPLRDLAYAIVAGLRRLWPRPESVCPLLPPELASRFEP